MRHVILHFHYFKNAGTSLDTILKRNFQDRWATAEFSGPGNPGQLADWILGAPQVIAFSSHTADFPLPHLDGVRIHPVLFLRHPISRIRSVYAFERHQQADSVGTRIARTTDFKGYIEARLAIRGDRQLRNFQCFRLSRFSDSDNRSGFERAMAAVTQLPFIGIVENFGESMRRLEHLLRPCFPHFHTFPVWENATSPPESGLAERLDSIRGEIGESLWQRLLKVNRADMLLYEAVVERLEKIPAPHGQIPHPEAAQACPEPAV